MSGPATDPVACQPAPRERRFAAAAVIVFLGTLVANVLLFAFSVMASRWLGPGPYGVVAAMLALTVVLTIPSFSLQIVVARETAAVVDGSEAEVGAVLRRRVRQAVIAGGAATLIVWGFAGAISGALNLVSPWPVILTAAGAVPLLVTYVARGVFQGGRRYVALSTSLVIESAARLAAGVVALAAGTGATGTSAALSIGVVVSAAAALGVLRRPLSAGRGRSVAGGGTRAAWATGAFFTGYALLTNIDVLIVKHAVPVEPAGEYAAAALYGKIVLLLPIAVGLVVVPEVTVRVAEGRPTRPILAQALAFVSGACGILVGIAYVAPHLVRVLTVGDGYEGAEPLLGPYALAMLAMALAGLVALYTLALGRGLVGWLAAAAVPLEAAAMLAVRSDPRHVIWVSFATGAVLTAVGLLVASRPAPVIRPRA